MKIGKIVGVLLLLSALFLNSSPAVAQSLLAYAEGWVPEVIEVVSGVYVAVGYGPANSTLIEGDDGVIIVDTMEGANAAERVLEEFRKITEKPVKAIIYTHSHPDHIGGAKVFAKDTQPDIYARANFSSRILEPNELERISKIRTYRQHGFVLSLEECIELGMLVCNPSPEQLGKDLLPPDHTFDQERFPVEIAGVKLELVAAPGESDDQLYVWLPDKKALLCGDNYYKAFPNLYSIKGSGYRDVSEWANSLDSMLRENPEYLIPGHTFPVSGAKEVKQVLTDYRDAIRFVRDRTLEGMNQGLTPDQLVEFVKLPPELAEKPYLQEIYGTVPWAVRSIFMGSLGWFDGNPTHLYPLSPIEESQRVARLAGGNQALLKALQDAVASEDYEWALQLADHLIALQFHTNEAKQLKSDALTALAKAQNNVNAQNYYMSVAKELRQQIEAENSDQEAVI